MYVRVRELYYWRDFTFTLVAVIKLQVIQQVQFMELWLPRVIKMDWAWFIYLNQLNIYLFSQCVRGLQMLSPWWLVCGVCQATVDLLIYFLSWLGVFYRPGSCRPASGLSINMWVSQLMTGLWRWNNSTVKFIYNGWGGRWWNPLN